MWGFVVDSRCMSIEAEILRTPYLRISTTTNSEFEAVAYMRTFG